MDTKSVKNKKFVIIKVLSIFFSVILAMSTMLSVVYSLCYISLDSSLYRKTLSGENASVSRIDIWNIRAEIYQNMNDLLNLATYDGKKAELDELRKQKEEIVDQITKQFLETKAQLIHDELYYVATNYDTEYNDEVYYREYISELGESYTQVTRQTEETTAREHTETTTFAESTTSVKAETGENATETTTMVTTINGNSSITVDERAPYNVRLCQLILSKSSGLDYLKYEHLVRDEAFKEKAYNLPLSDYFPITILYNDNYTIDFHSDESTARNLIQSVFESVLSVASDRYEREKNENESSLGQLVNLKYLIRFNDGRTLSNEAVYSEAIAKSSKVFLEANQNDYADKILVLTHIPFSTSEYDKYINDFTISFYLNDEFAPGDNYYFYGFIFDNLLCVIDARICLLTGVISFVLFIVALCIAFRRSGINRNGEIPFRKTDKIPLPVHMLISAVIYALLILLAFYISAPILNRYERFGQINKGDLQFIITVIQVLSGIAVLFMIELRSAIRRRRNYLSSHRSNGKKTNNILRAIKKIFLKVLRFFKKIFLNLAKNIKSIKSFTKFSLLILIGFAVLLIVPCFIFADELFGVTVYYLLIILAFFAIIFKVIKNIQTISKASEDRTLLPIPNTGKMILPIRMIAEALTITEQERKQAIADAVKNERTKSELITNVSHDLKTPLTSIINYVDLLKQCELRDEEALKYLDVLEEKSANLKRLIEDLIEASKITAGNITLHPAPLNLNELALQSIAECSSELEDRGLDVRYTAAEDEILIFADGTKTYRILGNLLSNVRKYSAENTRVYISVSKNDSFGLFEIKNISDEPLDLSPEELTERFVRGDKSRSKDGNGLGLSIAQQLSVLQGGKLDISIDGDLFKVIVSLPLG